MNWEIEILKDRPIVCVAIGGAFLQTVRTYNFYSKSLGV